MQFQYRFSLDFLNVGARIAPSAAVKPGLAWERKEREYFHEKVTSQQRMSNC